MDDEQVTRISEKFNDTSAELVFESSDNVRFYIQKIYLSCSTGYAIPNLVASKSEIIKLEESSDVLEILFCFIYPQHQPHLRGMAWELFSLIAEAAEKYQVYNAINVCAHARMFDHAPSSPYGVLQFAWLHDDEELMDTAASYTLKALDVVMANKYIHSLELMKAWTVYVEHYRSLKIGYSKYSGTPIRFGESWRERTFVEFLQGVKGGDKTEWGDSDSYQIFQ